MFKYFVSIVLLTMIGSSMAIANPTAKAILSIPGSTYKVTGFLKFNQTFTVSEGSLYAAKIRGKTKISYELTHNQLIVNFMCDRRYDRSCGSGAFIATAGMEFNVKRAIFRRSSQEFEVQSESRIPGVQGYINRNVKDELNAQLKSKMMWGLNRLRTLVRTRETDPAVISGAITEFLDRVSADTAEGDRIDVPGFSGGSTINLTPGEDAIVRFEELYLHFKKNQPVKGELQYRKSRSGSLIQTSANAYLNQYPSRGLVVSQRADGEGMKVKVQNVFVSAERGLTMQSTNAVDRDINTAAYLIGSIVELSGGGRMSRNCCRFDISLKRSQ